MLWDMAWGLGRAPPPVLGCWFTRRVWALVAATIASGRAPAAHAQMFPGRWPDLLPSRVELCVLGVTPSGSRGFAYFPPGTAFLGHRPEGSMGAQPVSEPKGCGVGSRSWRAPGTRAVSQFGRAESIRFGFLIR